MLTSERWLSNMVTSNENATEVNIMTILYNVFLGTKQIAVVKGVQPIVSGNYFAETGEYLTPDWQAVREAVPYIWLKAFDRATKWNADGTKRAYATLTSLQGKHLSTVICEGYMFKGYPEEN